MRNSPVWLSTLLVAAPNRIFTYRIEWTNSARVCLWLALFKRIILQRFYAEFCQFGVGFWSIVGIDVFVGRKTLPTGKSTERGRRLCAGSHLSVRTINFDDKLLFPRFKEWMQAARHQHKVKKRKYFNALWMLFAPCDSERVACVIVFNWIVF